MEQLFNCLKTDIMQFVSKCIELGKVMLGRVIQTQKDIYGMHSLLSDIIHHVKDNHAIINRPKSLSEKEGRGGIYGSPWDGDIEWIPKIDWAQLGTGAGRGREFRERHLKF